jgi:rare lipoprotein A (peptidoglycan hydrolase)
MASTMGALARSFHGKTSASGEPFDERKRVAAHRTSIWILGS